jgi:hypothetical protein
VPATAKHSESTSSGNIVLSLAAADHRFAAVPAAAYSGSSGPLGCNNSRNGHSAHFGFVFRQ